MKFIALLTSLSLLLPSFSFAKSDYQFVAASYQEVVIEKQLADAREKFEKLTSWKQLRNEDLSDLSEEDQKAFREKVAEIEGSPFKKPKFTPHKNGWSLEMDKFKFTVDLMEKTVTRKGETFFFGDKNVSEFFDWVEGKKKTSYSFSSLLIPEAHAYAIVGAIVIGVLLVQGCMDSMTKWSKKRCRNNYQKLNEDLNEKLRICSVDNQNNAISEQTVKFVDEVRKTLKENNSAKLVSELTMSTCKKFMVKHMACITQDEANQLCGIGAQLSQCVDELSNKAAIHNGERAREKDGPKPAETQSENSKAGKQ